MCLNTIQEKTKIAKKDITCYKVLTYKVDDTNGDIIYLSPFFDFVWYRNHPNPVFSHMADTSWYIENGKEDKKLSNIGYYDDKGNRHKQYQVHSGYFHTFKFKSDAEDLFVRLGSNKLVIVECTIPAGTSYYEGHDSNGCPSYASLKLKIVEKIL